jgi:hypothetical protein
VAEAVTFGRRPTLLYGSNYPILVA